MLYGAYWVYTNQHVKLLQEFWSTMDEIDKVLWVVDPTKATHGMCHRRIALGNFLILLDLVVVLHLLLILLKLSCVV